MIELNANRTSGYWGHILVIEGFFPPAIMTPSKWQCLPGNYSEQPYRTVDKDYGCALHHYLTSSEGTVTIFLS